jgi:hypothetical protein
MGPIESVFVWLGGYSPKNVTNDHPEDREAITKIGAAILFASVIALMNWGLAGWTYSEGFGEDGRLAAAIVAGLLGATLVLIFDRGFVYLTDTSDGSRLSMFVYAAFRIGVIVGVGSITAQAVMPLVLSSELRAHALSMVEASEARRSTELGSRFDVAGKEAKALEAGKEVQALEAAAATVPPDIQRRLAAAKTCWATFSTRKAALILSGIPEDDAQERLSGKFNSCARDTKLASNERDEYLARTRNQLNRAIDGKLAHESELAETKSTIKSRLTRARDVEETSLNPRSSSVLWDLLSTNPGARAKWAIISLLLLVCELLPLIQKFQAGQSAIGRRIAASRRARIEGADSVVRQAQHDSAVSKAVSAASLRGVEDALRSPDLRGTFAKAFADTITATAPIEAVGSLMRDLESKHVDVEDFTNRFPRYAAFISQAWSQGIKLASQLMTSSSSPIVGPGYVSSPN